MQDSKILQENVLQFKHGSGIKRVRHMFPTRGPFNPDQDIRILHSLAQILDIAHTDILTALNH
jgi:hypothetical protein